MAIRQRNKHHKIANQETRFKTNRVQEIRPGAGSAVLGTRSHCGDYANWSNVSAASKVTCEHKKPLPIFRATPAEKYHFFFLIKNATMLLGGKAARTIATTAMKKTSNRKKRAKATPIVIRVHHNTQEILTFPVRATKA